MQVVDYAIRLNTLYRVALRKISFTMLGSFLAVTCSPNILLIDEKAVSASTYAHDFISDYEYSKLFKRRMDKLAEEEEEQQPELEKVEEQPLVASN